jgi:hypothetical protein
MLADAGRPRSGVVATVLGIKALLFAAIGICGSVEGCREYSTA